MVTGAERHPCCSLTTPEQEPPPASYPQLHSMGWDSAVENSVRSVTCRFTRAFQKKKVKIKGCCSTGMHHGLAWWHRNCIPADEFPCCYSLRQLWDAGMLHLTLKSFLTVPVVPLWISKWYNEHGKRRGCKGSWAAGIPPLLCGLLSAQNNLVPNSAHLGALIRKKSKPGHGRLMAKWGSLWKDVIAKSSVMLRLFVTGKKPTSVGPQLHPQEGTLAPIASSWQGTS